MLKTKILVNNVHYIVDYLTMLGRLKNIINKKKGYFK